jgi:hypothetical protein
MKKECIGAKSCAGYIGHPFGKEVHDRKMDVRKQ